MSSCEDEFWRKEEMEGRKRGRERREGKEGTRAHTTERIYLLHIVQVDWLCSILSCAIFNLPMFSRQSAVSCCS